MTTFKPCLLALAIAGFTLQAEEKAPSWDVNAPQGQFETVDINVQQGSWMNITVSPAGKPLAFDLLGDIYTMPIGGGKATALTLPGICSRYSARMAKPLPLPVTAMAATISG